MHPKNHPLLHPKNILELIFQIPIWIILYGSGLIVIVTAFSWFLYAVGQHIHPKKYPLIHVLLMDFLAELIIWVRVESKYSGNTKKNLGFLYLCTNFNWYSSYFFWLCKLFTMAIPI